ncbi:hypothetical protein [Brevibacillus laterosporus]|uniref:hypothetical protein n=1 Tax=Brevibacillus laterosporus TaxID=1465 RepID=UPI00265CC22E|nr:hypothetical protein [Brevibacillus laterosporus]
MSLGQHSATNPVAFVILMEHENALINEIKKRRRHIHAPLSSPNQIHLTINFHDVLWISNLSSHSLFGGE